ncbi:MAG: chromate transporter [Oscillospiraceae bacterium]|nr:chromate transporter [Oscillospiraceae bacterium]
MIYLQLFFEFAKIGLFNFGGGMAALPFLQDLSVRTCWYTFEEMANFIAISESTPGPMAINMATYVGYTTGGFFGSCMATLGIIFPALFVTTLVAKFLSQFRDNKYVNRAFYGLRPCVLALIASALVSLVGVTMLNDGWTFQTITSFINYKAILIFAVIFAMLRSKKLGKIHPVVFLALSRVMGLILY